MSRFEKITNVQVKIIESTVKALSVALCCASTAPSVPEIRLPKVCKYAQCDCEKTVITILLSLHFPFLLLSTYYQYMKKKMVDSFVCSELFLAVVLAFRVSTVLR